MKSYKLKNGVEKVYNNIPKPPRIEWKENFLNAEKILNEIISSDNWFDLYKGNVIFKVVYTDGNLPPKTNRIKFRNNIQDVFDIPQKSMSIKKTMFNGKETFNVVLIYEISLEELENFKENIMLIHNNKEFLKAQFNNAKSNRQSIVKNLSIIKNFSRVDEFKIGMKQGEKKYIKFLPISDNLLAIIKSETNLDIEMINNFEYSSILSYDQFNEILKTIPWIIKEISAIEDLSLRLPKPNHKIEGKAITLNELIQNSLSNFEIPENNYDLVATVGVIDSGCSLPVSWNNYIINNCLIEDGTISDYDHGSRVSSIIIANDLMNSSKDNLGFFKVKHFELLSKMPDNSQAQCNFFHLQKNIFEIIENNSDIKVWNLSLGGEKNPWGLNVSTIGMMLDYLSNKYNVLFVVAVGNSGEKNLETSVNSPGDSLNCISVGSVSIIGNKVVRSSYSSLSEVLQFIKPEVSGFGGIKNEDGQNLVAFNGNNFDAFNEGTSFSAPKISRLAAYLIHNGFSTLEAKAKILALSIDESPSLRSSAFGYISNNNNNRRKLLDLRYSSELSDKKPRYIDINLMFVEKMTIAVTHFVNPAPDLGEEYSLTNFEISLVKYKKNWKDENTTPEKSAESIKKINKYTNSAFKKEILKRKLDGKYFTSKKVIYKIDPSEIDLEREQYAIRFRRMDLYEFKENSPLKFGCSIILEGEKLTEEIFERNNQSIIDINIDINIDI